MKEYFVWLAKFVTWILVIFFLIPVMLIFVGVASKKALEEAPIAGNKTVAVIELTGMITSAKDILKDLYHQADNDKVKGIVLRIDSPGGAVGPSQEIYAAVKKLKEKKPIVVSMGALAASGGLYSALGASEILCSPGTLTGSIGVILEIPNFTKIAEKVGVDMITIKSGKFKDAGNSFRPMTEEDRAYFEATINTAYKDFFQAVVDARHLKPEDVTKFADGRIVLGSQAKEIGLVDGFGDVYDAAREVLKLAKSPILDSEMPELFYPSDKFKELRKFIDSVLSLPMPLSSHVQLKYIM
jgi:protease-4